MGERVGFSGLKLLVAFSISIIWITENTGRFHQIKIKETSESLLKSTNHHQDTYIRAFVKQKINCNNLGIIMANCNALEWAKSLIE